jgi:hypothetical protein
MKKKPAQTEWELSWHEVDELKRILHRKQGLKLIMDLLTVTSTQLITDEDAWWRGAQERHGIPAELRDNGRLIGDTQDRVIRLNPESPHA